MRAVSTTRKTECVINEPANLTTGRILKGNTTFFTRCELFIITLVEPLTISLKVFQTAMAAVSHTTKGTFPFGAALNPTPKTNHNMKIVIIGLMKVQKMPSMEPTCCVIMSLFAISKIRNLRWYKVRRKLPKPVNINMTLFVIYPWFSIQIIKHESYFFSKKSFTLLYISSEFP